MTVPGATVGSGRLQKLHLPWKGCHSTPFTAPASLRSKVYARVWRFCCRPSGSSESPPHPQSPLNPDFGNPRTLTCWSHSHAGPSPLRLTFVVCQAQYWALGTRYLTSATQLGNGGPKRLGDWPKVTQPKGACQVRILTHGSLTLRGAFPAVSRFSSAPEAHAQTPSRPPRPPSPAAYCAPAHPPLNARSVSLIECGPVRTAFQEKLEGGPGGALDGADAETRDLFSRYQRHLERIFHQAAQDPEEVTEVGAGRGPGSTDGAWGLAASRGQARPPAAPGLPRRAARTAPRAALLQHGALPAPGAHACHRPQRPQLRRRHAPRGVRRRASRGVRCRPRRPCARRSSRRPAIKAWPAAVCRALLCDPRGARFWGGGETCATGGACSGWVIWKDRG